MSNTTAGIGSRFRSLVARFLGKGPAPQATGPRGTPVDDYWGRHTVNSKPFTSAQESLDYLEWRFGEYPLFREFMGLYGDHTGQTVVDYGCGPGNDVVGYLVYSKAKVIGIDVSAKALDLARHRIALHGIDPARYQLIRKSDADVSVPLETASVDHIYCEGVLHHTSDPAGILAEFHRVLKPNGTSCIMVYNKDSLFRNLWTAYGKMVLEGAFAGLSLDEAFTRNTDGEECPISRSYGGEEFCSMCREAGFDTEFRGGYLFKFELRYLAEHGAAALSDPRLPQEQRRFLRELTRDVNGFPMYRGKHAGIGGVYWLQKRS